MMKSEKTNSGARAGKNLPDGAAEFILSWAQGFHWPGPVNLIAQLEKLPDGHNAQRLVESHPALRELLATDTVVPQETNWPELKVVTVAPLLAGTIPRLAAHQSISDLFD